MAKGILIRDESQRSHIYAPARRRTACNEPAEDLMQKAFAGSAKALVLAALRTASRKRARRNRKML
jgi:predicted transcriptional regulator